MDHVETLGAAFIENPDQIDDNARPAHRGLDRARITHIGLHGMDLPDAAERLQEIGEFRSADGDADAVAALGERAHDMAAEEAGAAKNGDKGVGVGLKGHEVRTRAAILFLSLSLAKYRIEPALYRATKDGSPLWRANPAAAARIGKAADRLRQQLLRQPQDDVRKQHDEC